MRSIVRPLVAALSIAFTVPAAAVLVSGAALAQSDQPDQPDQPGQAGEDVKQMALTDAQIQAAIAAKKELDPILQKMPEGADKPDPKVTAQLDAIAKKHKFADYAEYDDVIGNIGLVMSGIDPDTKKYVGTEAVIKKQIAQVQADKSMSAKDKKDALDQLNGMLKAAAPVQFSANIPLVVKYYDKLAQLMQE
jgi:hypothetical protein